MQTQIPALFRSRAICALLCASLAGLVFAPALAAGFHPEDLGWLALMRHIDTPWPLLTDNPYFVYFSRPVALLFWWLTTKIAGLNAGWHNAIDLILHAGNAALLALLAARLSGNMGAAWIAGLSFAVLPAASGTVLWMSDRFDPLALLFSVSALLAFEAAIAARAGARSGPLILTALFTLLALLSKEVAYAVPALMLLRLAWQGFEQRRIDARLGMVVLLPVALAVALRLATVQSVGDSIGAQSLGQALFDGSLAWWRTLPAALMGFRTEPPGAFAALVVYALLALSGLAVCIRQRDASVLRLLLAGSVLLIIPSIIQWPVTSQVLVHDAARTLLVNLRFFHIGMAAVALLLAAGWCGMRVVSARVAFALVVTLMGSIWFGLSRDNAHDWAHGIAANSASMLTLGRELGAMPFPPGCQIRLDVTQLAGKELIGLDLMVKAGATPGAAILACAVVEAKQFAVLVPASACSAEHWPGLTVRALSHGPAIARFGNLCTIAFEAAPLSSAAAQPSVFHFSVDANGHPRQALNP